MGGNYARTNLPEPVPSASYDAANQLLQWGSSSLSYDANGNLINDEESQYTWNARNQLTAISGGASASFQYDAYGRRNSKTVGGAATGFLYDGVNAVQELSGTTPTANILSGGIDETFQRTDSGGTFSFLPDALGSTLALTNVNGAFDTQYTYTPYGATTAITGTSTNSSQYTGRENDSTGLYYYRARYYNPQVGRFVSEDPIGLRGGINFYAHVLNSPLQLRDPSGLESEGLALPTADAEQSANACKRKAKKLVCGDSPDQGILDSLLEGGLKGAWVGAESGFAGGTLTSGVGGVPGALIGGFVGGVVGAGSGVIYGGMTVAACYYAGAYEQ